MSAFQANTYFEDRYGKPARVLHYLAYMRLTLICFLALVLGFLARWSVFTEIGTRTPDEYYYRTQARTLVQNGFVTGARINMETYHREEWRWKNPPSSRLGFVAVLALAQSVSGTEEEVVGAAISLGASLITTLCIVVCAYLLGGVPLALCAAIVSAFLPHTLAMAVRSWTDGLMECLGAVAFLGAVLMRKEGRLFWLGFALSFVSAFYIIWVKESGYIVSALFIIPALLYFERSQFSWRRSFKIVLAPVLGTIAGFVVLSLVLGGFDEIPKVFHHLQVAVPQADYARDYQDGPWYDFVLMWLHLSPVTLSLLFVSWAIFFFSARRDLKLWDYLGLWLIVCLFMIPPCVFLYYKNIRYLSPLYPIFAVLVSIPLAYLVRHLWSRGGFGRIGASIALMVLVLGMVFDFLWSQQVIVVAQCQDLNLRMLKDCRGLK